MAEKKNDREFNAPGVQEKVCGIRKCSFNPEEHAIRIRFKDSQDANLYLPVQKRVDWFQTYCEENGISDSCIDDGTVTQIGNYITVTASVSINGKLVGRSAGGYYLDPNAGTDDLAYAVQQAGTIAKGRALANAGFGNMFSAGLIQENGASEIMCDSGFKIPAERLAQNPMLHRMQTNATPAEAVAKEDKPAEKAQHQMTREEAFRVLIPAGKYKGQAMGDVMGMNPNTIKYFADTDRYGDDIQTAAKLVLKR